jgi:RimJ/RimL family protein N-acetyltransferase
VRTTPPLSACPGVATSLGPRHKTHKTRDSPTIFTWGDPDEREVTYWIGRSYWGNGIATGALAVFLTVEQTRPLHAHVAYHNVASRRVLEKCGFRVIAPERGFAEARSGEIEELVLRLAE